MNENLTGAFIVSFYFSKGNDGDVLIVGNQKKRGNVEIVNAFQGKDAMDIYKLLTTKKEK